MLRALLVVAALAAPVAADPITVDSVEAATADADVVVRGTIKRAVRMTRPDRPDASWFDVTMVVHETLKGPHHGTVRFAVRELFCRRVWETRPSHLVVFLVETKRRRDATGEVGHPGFGAWSFAPREHSLYPALDHIDLGARLAIHDRALQVLDTPGAVLAAIRAASGQDISRVHFLEADVGTPSYRALSTGAPLEKVLVAVPADAALEQLAQRWLDDKDELVQYQGLRAIGWFPTPARRAHVQRLAADPSVSSFLRDRAQRLLDDWALAPPPKK